MTLKQEKIAKLVEQLETVVDIRYKINKETDYCNHSYVVKTLAPKYKNAKDNFEQTLKEILDNNSES